MDLFLIMARDFMQSATYDLHFLNRQMYVSNLVSSEDLNRGSSG